MAAAGATAIARTTFARPSVRAVARTARPAGIPALARAVVATAVGRLALAPLATTARAGARTSTSTGTGTGTG
ncbi:MAG: hypothetical protein JWQ11_1151, partial [Rhizobacter sp.]|nr:hypothetical protein [Rhizobacter sp.]